MSGPEGHDMSRYWRLVSVEGGTVTGTWWVHRTDNRGIQRVRAIDVIVWVNPERDWGRNIAEAEVAIGEDGGAMIQNHTLHDSIRADVMAQPDAFTASALAAAAAVEWGDDDE